MSYDSEKHCPASLILISRTHVAPVIIVWCVILCEISFWQEFKLVQELIQWVVWINNVRRLAGPTHIAVWEISSAVAGSVPATSVYIAMTTPSDPIDNICALHCVAFNWCLWLLCIVPAMRYTFFICPYTHLHHVAHSISNCNYKVAARSTRQQTWGFIWITVAPSLFFIPIKV